MIKYSVKISIRKTRSILTIKALFMALFSDVDWKWVNKSKSVYWLIYEDTMPVGFASAYMLARENMAYFTLAGVVKNCRGKGYQKKLINARIRWAKRQKATHAITYTSTDNVGSFESLQTCGFRLYAPECKWVGDDVLYWIKKL